MDLGRSLTQQFGSDSSESVYEHTAILGRIALEEFIRRGRGIPMGLFEDCLLRFSPRMVDIFRGRGKPIVLVPVGKVEGTPIALVCRVIWEVFGLPVRVLRARAVWPDAYDPKANVLDAEMSLRKLRDREYLEGASRVIALTNIPLMAKREISENNQCGSVYGYAGLVVPVSVCSLGRLASENSMEEACARIVKVVVHELAHTFGVVHCKTEYCVMNTQLGRDGRPGLDYMGHELCTICLGQVMTNKAPHVVEKGQEAQQ